MKPPSAGVTLSLRDVEALTALLAFARRNGFAQTAGVLSVTRKVAIARGTIENVKAQRASEAS